MATNFGKFQSSLRIFKAHADHAVRVRIPGGGKCAARNRQSPEEAADLEDAIEMGSKIQTVGGCDRGKEQEKGGQP